MSRMNQVMQIGEIRENFQVYIEDYAYTYLKKQKGQEKTKYFLYGEKEENDLQMKLYIYGIAEKPKMEQTYFKEHYPLGFLKIKGDDAVWVSLKGQEEKITGIYVFYAPNQAMQEYLVDHREVRKEEKQEGKRKRIREEDMLPIKEKLVSVKKSKRTNSKKEFKNEKFLFPISGILAACVILFALTTANGKQKVEIFRKIIAETISGNVIESEEETFIIEEKNTKKEEDPEVIAEEDNTEEAAAAENNQSENSTTEVISETSKNEVDISDAQIDTNVQQVNEWKEYIVKEGDTLAAICKHEYGNLDKMEEICSINKIKNADYIAPGQKIYLP